MKVELRRVLLVLVALTAIVALLAGLARLGVVLPGGTVRAASHGPLFVLGVFGTVIALERAVAYGAPWAYSAPVASGAAAAMMLAGIPGAPYVAAAAAVALAIVNARIVARQNEPFTWLMLLGAIVLVAGNVAWALGRPVFEVVPAWAAFFVLTVTSERLELSRLTPTPRWAARMLVVLSALLVLSVVVGAWRAVGIALVALASWQLRFDIARRTIRMHGVARFSATGVLLGASWLLVAGLVLVRFGLVAAGPLYDAFVHAVMVGFVLSSVFAHVPLILPAVARVRVPFHAAFYAPLAVLEVGLAARLAGDLLGVAALRTVGGSANALAIVLFLVTVLAVRARPQERTKIAA